MLAVLLISGCTTYTYNLNISVDTAIGTLPLELVPFEAPVRNPHNPYYDGRRNY